MEKELLSKLKVVMAAKEKIDGDIKLKKETFEESIKGERFIQETYDTEINNLKSQLSEMAIKSFEETGSKNFTGGLKVQEFKKINYDEKIALSWALEKRMFLQFDKKSFEKSAENLNLDFVSIDKTLRTTFPSEIKI